jgi:hypothetical protein
MLGLGSKIIELDLECNSGVEVFISLIVVLAGEVGEKIRSRIRGS